MQDSKVRLYDWKNGTLAARSGVFDSNRGAVGALAFTPDGKLLAAGDVRFSISVSLCAVLMLICCSRWERSLFTMLRRPR